MLLSTLAHFNSTMVRLKASLVANQYKDRIHFNSTMVRLKVRGVFDDALGGKHFNSTMVRLKGLDTYSKMPSGMISIPLWYD